MADAVATLNYDGIHFGGPKNASFVLPNGHILVIVPISATQFRIYTDGGGTSFTTAATITVTAMNATASKIRWSAALSRDGTQIMLCYTVANGNVRSTLVTISGWSAGTEQLGYNGTAFISSIAVSQSSGGAWLMAGLFSAQQGASGGLGVVFSQRTAAGAITYLGAWTYKTPVVFDSTTADLDIEFYNGGSATKRGFAMAISANSRTVDYGVSVFSGKIHETTPAMPTIASVGVALTEVWKLANAHVIAAANGLRRVKLARGSANGLIYLGCTGGKSYTGSGQNFMVHSPEVAVLQATSQLDANANDPFAIQTYARDAPATELRMSAANGPVSDLQFFTSRGTGNVIEPAFTFIQGAATNSPGYAAKLSVIRIEGSALNPIFNDQGDQGTLDGDMAYGVAGCVMACQEDTNTINTVRNAKQNFVTYSRTTDKVQRVRILPPTSAQVPAVYRTLKNIDLTSSKPEFTVEMNNFKSYAGVSKSFRNRVMIGTDDGTWAVDPQEFTTAWFKNQGNLTGVGTIDNRFKWAGTPIPQEPRYWGIYTRDVFGNTLLTQNAASYTVSHPPIAVEIEPDNKTVPYVDAAGLNSYSIANFKYKFSDSWDEDSQTAVQATLYDNTGAQLWTSGKVVKTEKSIDVQIPYTHKNVELKVAIQLWDIHDKTTTPPHQATISSYAPPTIDSFALVTTDPNGYALTNRPTFSYTTTPSLMQSVRLDIEIMKGGETIQTKSLSVFPEDGNIQVDYANLKNVTYYSARLRLVDSTGLVAEATTQFLTAWTPPAATVITVDTSQYNTENSAAVILNWADTTRDADFVEWRVYRKIDIIDPNTQGVLVEGTLELLDTITDIANSYTYYDKYAPSAHRISYLVRQVVNRFGDGTILESDSTTLVVVYPVSEGYWLIDPTPENNNFSSFKLYNVVEDSYTHKYESSIMHVIGRGNHEDRGDDLGVEGSFTAHLRDGQGTSARQKKIRVEAMKAFGRDLLMRTPFGDMYLVSVGDITVGRIAGVALNEFVDITLPYTEVYG